MKRVLISLSAIFAVTGCGGSQEAATVPAKQAATAASPPSVASVDKATTTTHEKASPTSTTKKNVEAPGLVLPEDDADVVSGKGPDLPIR